MHRGKFNFDAVNHEILAMTLCNSVHTHTCMPFYKVAQTNTDQL